MTLIVEDGTGKVDAQVYASVDYVRLYARARGIAIPSSNAELEAMLLAGMQPLRGLNYVGNRATKDQALDWPRLNVVIDGFAYEASELPRELAEAHCVLSIESRSTDLLPTLVANATGAVIERTVGEITTRYADSGRVLDRPNVQKASVLLRKLLRNSGASMQIIRA